jgi:pilus assembly protein CpaD
MRAITLDRPTAVLLLLLFSAAWMITGCAPEAARYSEAEAPQTDVRFVSVEHPVFFLPKRTTLGPGEFERLDEFIYSSGASRRDMVVVSVTGETPVARQRARAEAVVAAIEARGLVVDAVERAAVPEPDRPDVVVLVGRYVAIPPACPDWSKTPTTDYSNRASSNFGCANRYNLSQMVANPRDLIVGESTDPADGIVSTQSINRYRQRVTEKLQEQSSRGN